MPFYKITKFLLIFLWFNLAFSQNYPSKNYTAANELPNNSVRSLLIDSNNILWIGTENGVVKKENDVFEYFFEEDGLALNSCWAIAEDKNKNLWFGSYGEGISIYDGVSFKVISENDGLVHNQITKLFSRGNYMYVGSSNGISLVDINTHEILASLTPAGNELFRIQDFFEYQEEIYVATYNSGIFKIRHKNKQASLVKVNEHKYIYSVLVGNDSIYSSNKGFFIKNKLADYVHKNDSVPSAKHGKSIIWDYAKTDENKIYAAAWGIYNTNGGIYKIVDNELIPRSSQFNIESKEVISLAYDPGFKKLYVGTKDAGLYEVILKSQIKFHEITGKDVLGFAGTKTSNAVLLNDAIVIKTAGKDYEINLSQLKKWQEKYVANTKIPLPKYQDDFYELDYNTKAGDISFYDIKAANNMYWINTNIGLFAINYYGILQRYLPLHTEEINFTQEGNLIETNPYGGVRVYSDQDVLKYNHYTREDSQTPTMVVNSLQLGNKTYFLSVFSGLYVWEDNEFKSYLQEGIWKEKKLRHVSAYGNDIAISNEFGDVFIVNDTASFEIVKKIPRANIQGNSISFLKLHCGTLIIGTEKGLTLFKNEHIIFLNKEQGLEQPLLTAEVSDDVLSIGSNNGYYIVDLNAIGDSKNRVNNLKIKEIFINNEKLPLRKSLNKEQVELAYNQNTVLIKFSANSHPFPRKLKYQYRLQEKENWSPPSSRPEIFLPSLPTKDYSVDVKVLDESTGLNYSQRLLNLAILPPFWKTWWFALITTIIIIIGAFSIYRFQIKQTRQFEEQKGLIQKRFEETKMEALLSQMNPHFIFNAMNSIQYYMMDRDIEKATVFLGDFAKLIRLNLDHCTKPSILLIEEIEYLQAYIRVENTRFNNTIKVIYDIDPLIDTYEVEIPTMLLQTFVENVFVHAFPKSISNPTLKISFKLLSEAMLQCRIEDNGIGFCEESKNKLHKSRGVSLVKERLALLGYDIDHVVQINSSNKGTTVILELQV